MNEDLFREWNTTRLTHLARALADVLEAAEAPVFSEFQLYLNFRPLYKNPKGLYLREAAPTLKAYRRVRKSLIDANILGRDPDYPRAYRVLSRQDVPADEVSCVIDPFCYISHLSAMQRFGLTERRPEALHMTVPSKKIIADMLEKEMEKAYGAEDVLGGERLKITVVHHPNVVRKRAMHIHTTSGYGEAQKIRGTFARVSTIGQTFLDMLDEPALCGGMSHVREVWSEHAKYYLDNIISAVEKTTKGILRVRAGYLLDEVLKIKRREIDSWVTYAQRGGSRVLDPSKPFVNVYSEKWMISINV